MFSAVLETDIVPIKTANVRNTIPRGLQRKVETFMGCILTF